MQRHAVHRRGHAVLAHAVMDVAAGEVGARSIAFSVAWSWCCSSRSGRPSRRSSRAAPGLITSSTFLERLAGRQLRLLGGELRLEGGDRRVDSRRAGRRCMAAVELGAVAARPARRGACPGLRAPARRAAPTPAPGGEDRLGDHRTARTSSRASCARRRSRRRRAASRGVAAVPALVGAPKPMMVLQAIIDGLSVTSARLRMARGDRVRVVAVDRAGRASRRRAKRVDLVVGRRRATVGPSIEMLVVVEQHDQLGRARDGRRARSPRG